MATAVPDAWTEFFLLGLTREVGGVTASEVQFAGITEDITGMEWGEKDIEGIALANGGRVTRKVPMTDESITFKVYPIDAELDGDGIVQNFHPQATDDTSVPIVVENKKERTKHKLVLLWSTGLPAAASTIPDSLEPAFRIQVINAYMTRYIPSFDGKISSAEMTFKWVPFQKDGTGNKREESTDGSAQLDAATTAVTAWN